MIHGDPPPYIAPEPRDHPERARDGAVGRTVPAGDSEHSAAISAPSKPASETARAGGTGANGAG